MSSMLVLLIFGWIFRIQKNVSERFYNISFRSYKHQFVCGVSVICSQIFIALSIFPDCHLLIIKNQDCSSLTSKIRIINFVVVVCLAFHYCLPTPVILGYISCLLLVCGISLTSPQLIKELFPDKVMLFTSCFMLQGR